MEAPMSHQRRYLFSAVTNWLAFAAILGVAFFISPYLVRKLGDSTYGVWAFVESLLAYLTLFDMGIAAGVVRFTARYHAEGDARSLNRLVSTALALFLGFGAIAFGLGLGLAPFAFTPLEKSGVSSAEITAFALLMLANLTLTLPLSVFPAILDGLEYFGVKSIVRIVSLAIRTVGTILLMENSPSLLGLGIILTATNLLEHAVLAICCFVYLPKLRVRRRYVDRAMFQQVKGYSIDAFLAMFAGRVTVQSGTIVIGICLSTPEITWFAIALRLVEFAKGLLRSAITTLTPAVSALEAANDYGAIRAVFLKGSRWALYLILPVHLALLVLGGSFLTTWLGSTEYATRCYPALIILAAALSLVVAQSVASRILYGMGRLRLFGRMALLEALLNICLCLLLVRPLGIVGIAWATVVPNALFCVFAIGYTCWILKIGWQEYLTTAWVRPLLAATIPLAIWTTANWTSTGWVALGLTILAGVAPFAVCVFALERWALRVRLPAAATRVVFQALPPVRSATLRG